MEIPPAAQRTARRRLGEVSHGPMGRAGFAAVGAIAALLVGGCGSGSAPSDLDSAGFAGRVAEPAPGYAVTASSVDGTAPAQGGADGAGHADPTASAGSGTRAVGPGPDPNPPTGAPDPRFANADLGRGEVLSFACRACHGLAPGDESPIGPSLAGVFGRRAATVEGFEYSKALRETDIVWTPDVLDRWLAQPADFLPGNDMAFAGFRSAEDRRDVIAYLLEHTSVPPAGQQAR